MASAAENKDWVNVRCLPAQRKRIDGVLNKLTSKFPVVKRAGAIRRALEIGIDALEKNPDLLTQT